MNLIQHARKDARRIVSDPNGFTVPITLKSGDFEITINGTAKKHHTTYNEEGLAVNSMQASCTVSTDGLTVHGYPFKNSAGEVSFKGHKVTWTDAVDGTVQYTVTEYFPDKLIGLIVLILKK